jgi:hypothetical protein
MGDRAVYWQLPVDAHVGFFVGVDFLDFKNSAARVGLIDAGMMELGDACRPNIPPGACVMLPTKQTYHGSERQKMWKSWHSPSLRLFSSAVI